VLDFHPVRARPVRIDQIAENRCLPGNENGLHQAVVVQANQQLSRTRRDRKRPLLRAPDREKVLRELLAVRDPLYREIADVVVSTNGRGARLVARDIVIFLRGGVED